MATRKKPAARTRKGPTPTKTRAKAKTMSDIGREMRQMPAEPLLPIEKKLIVWSLGLGAVLLVVLVWATETLFP
jgi:hypothetical protein